jgi:hypothetical protein
MLVNTEFGAVRRVVAQVRSCWRVCETHRDEIALIQSKFSLRGLKLSLKSFNAANVNGCKRAVHT